MEDFKKLKGRPELKSGKRSKKIDARFTEEEYNQILAMEVQFKISKTELVRMKVLGNAKQLVINAGEFIIRLDAIGADMGRIGNNINQLAHHANTLNLKGNLSSSIVDTLNELLDDYIGIQQSLEITLRKILRAMVK